MTQAADRIYYFAYGSCMDQASLTRSLEIDVLDYFVGPARLSGFQLVFNYASVPENVCFANIEARPDQIAEGALFHLPVEALPALDKREGVSSSRYGRFMVKVELDGGVFEALSYHGLVTLPFEASPSPRYRGMLEQGLSDARVSQAYRSQTLAHIDSLPNRSDMEREFSGAVVK
ncbi:gamma-glutamylcyclotransferase family protein [Litoreibacter janthinus]|uniref:AIG2-like family protein n=1 Tax=Litoreibacter janthinus TaxID=670154 RepID=A0A1I6FRD3_9RHOB|nr:gamma-glutamylcyclotransferase family protein [Litoreibacter janthinus]SFR32520.1 AIG2-like family protein [Litoreibacter janthinus]